MELIRAAKQMTNFVVPFSFGEEYDGKGFEKLVGEAHWEEMKTSPRENLLEHIDVLVRLDPKKETPKETIGRNYRLSQQGRRFYGLAKNESASYTYTYQDQRKGSFTFSIPTIRLFLFETGIGFVVYQMEYQDKIPVFDVADHLYHQKNFAKGYGHIYYQPNLVDSVYDYLEEKGMHVDKTVVRPRMKYGKTPGGILREFQEIDSSLYDSRIRQEEVEGLAERVISVELGEMTRKLVNFLTPTSYFHEFMRNGEAFPSYALVYSGLTLEPEFLEKGNEAERLAYLQTCLFRLRRSFKESYQPCERDLRLEDSAEVYQAFENSYWGFSLEGMVNLTYLVKDEKTNHFLQGNYYGNLEQSYFYLYIIALHQRYALLHLSKQATLLPHSIHDMMKDKGHSMDRLRERIAYFNLRSTFKHVSNITHQDRVYEGIHQSLQIDDLMDKIESEVDSLGSLVNLQKEVRHKKSERVYVGLSTVFVVISTISALWPLFNEFWVLPYQNEAFLGTSVGIILLGLFVIVGREWMVKE
ncbi:hypothetical protein Q75_15645 [Bacillus coahuilensis p1.1.43]|uniref:Uncharacterized protein n=1 Tax=Bacillus coahuilensis p1.1.43 TaxID=1150625 RepID=A0A147K4Q3_9BACI|nr:hypothetical protein [Bacillus coahuilensis]KUP04423.1 hypothetical protein Q75_15645 [Bacillus coahuilensis p1.1.43]